MRGPALFGVLPLISREENMGTLRIIVLIFYCCQNYFLEEFFWGIAVLSPQP